MVRKSRSKEEEAGTDKKQRTDDSVRSKPSALVNINKHDLKVSIVDTNSTDLIISIENF